MEYVKLFENWLLEASGEDIPKILQEGVSKNQKTNRDELNKLSKYGKLAEQIISAIDSYRSEYLTTATWKKLATEEGLNEGIENFKTLYKKVTDGDIYNTPLNKVLKNAFKYEFSDKVFSSKETVKAAEVINKGDSNLANSIGASVILAHLGIAITKGLYYYSKNIKLEKPDEKNKTAQDFFNNLGISSVDEFAKYGEEYFGDLVSEIKKLYMTAGTHGRTFAYDSYEVKTLKFQSEKVEPFINSLSLDMIKNKVKKSDSINGMRVLCSILAIGELINESQVAWIGCMNRFMEQGGPSWYQKLLG